MFHEIAKLDMLKARVEYDWEEGGRTVTLRKISPKDAALQAIINDLEKI